MVSTFDSTYMALSGDGLIKPCFRLTCSQVTFRLFLASHLESFLKTVNDMLVFWFSCPQNVVDVCRDHDHHRRRGEAVESIEDAVFCATQFKQHSSNLPP